MKNNVILLFFCVLLNPKAQAQTSIENIQVKYSADFSVKYWYMRHRLINHFMKVGIHSGESIPAQARHLSQSESIKWGDGTVTLGAYLGVLATEYKLLKMKNADTKQTIMELYYALEAINRLDYMAEYYWSGDVWEWANLNGFFVRTDVPEDFLGDPFLQGIYQYAFLDPYTGEIVNNYDHFNSNKAVPSTYPLNFPLPSLKYVERDFNQCSGTFNSFGEESQDQVIGLMTGLSLVARLVDTDLKFIDNTGEKQFMDNETLINKEARNISKRIVTYIKDNKWMIPNPVLDENNGTFQLVQANQCDRETLSKTNTTNITTGNSGGANVRFFAFTMSEAAEMIDYFMPGFQSSMSAASEFYFDVYAGIGDAYSDNITRNSYTNLWGPFTNFGIGFGLFEGNNNVAMNRDLALNSAAVGNSIYFQLQLLPFLSVFINTTGSYLKTWTHTYHLEYLAYIHDILHNIGDGTGNFNYPNDLDAEMLKFLQTAPCYGPWKLNCEYYGCNPSSIPENIPRGQWQSSDNSYQVEVFYASWRHSHGGLFKYRSNGYNQNDSETNMDRGEYNGLDYMLAHNLFLLTHTNFIPTNFSNMMDAVVDYTIPFYYSNGFNNLNLGSIQQNTPWKCYGFNSLDIHNAVLTSDAIVEFRTKNEVILDNNVYFPAGSSVVLNAGYDAYDCDPFGPIFELRLEDTDSEQNEENANFSINQSSSHYQYYSIHPNPNNGKVTISQSLDGYIKKIQLSTIMGQDLFEKEMDENFIDYKIDFNDFQKGIYILQLETTDGIKSERIIFQ